MCSICMTNWYLTGSERAFRANRELGGGLGLPYAPDEAWMVGVRSSLCSMRVFTGRTPPCETGTPLPQVYTR